MGPIGHLGAVLVVVGYAALAFLVVSSGLAYAFGWSVEKLPPGSGGILFGVSCTSTRACTAVGDSGVMRWNGLRWTAQKIPTSPVTNFLWLGGVSCASNRSCVAVGTDVNASTGGWQPVAGRWDGTRWSFQVLPIPPDGSVTLDSFHAVSCSSSSACTAVGYLVGAGGRGITLVERWDGGRWSLQTAARSAIAAFSGISCPSSRTCVAVGDFAPKPGESLPLAERWDGRRWSIQRLPRLNHAGLRGVSCTSSSACMAVGFGPKGTLAARWNGSGWSIQRTPGGASASFSAVSCSSSTVCTAVGGMNKTTLAERWEGGVWSMQQPIPEGHTAEGLPPPSLTLNSVSCPSRTTCTAVGVQFTTNYMPLVERWNGPLVPQVTG